MDVNNKTIQAEAASGKYDLETPEQKRAKEFKLLVSKLVVEQMGAEIEKIDDIKEEKGEDAAWEYVGYLLHLGVEVGLMYQGAKVQGLQNEVRDLKNKIKNIKKGKLNATDT
jgi:hypothetical protein